MTKFQSRMLSRPYQTAAHDYIVNYAVSNIRGRLLVTCPPGGGKTFIMAQVLKTLAADQGLRGLAYAHRRELIGQTYDHLVECGVPERMLGVIMAGDKRENPRAPIQVASVDTLHHREKPLADIVVPDEAHRDASDGRRRLKAMYPDALFVGFTGTPIRLDGRGLGEDYEHLYIAAQPSELIARGYIVAPRIFTVPPEMLPDLKGVKKRGGDFREDELEQRSNRRALVGSIVDHWQRRAENRRTIVFPVGIKHSKAIVARFKAAGIAAAHLDGETPHAERRAMIEALRVGDLRVVSSCGVLSEGINLPEVKCAVLARPTASLGLFIQQCGRPMRPWEGVEPIILDHAGNTIGQKHFLPHADREWTLTAARGKGGSDAQPVKECPACGLVVPAGLSVCGCGVEFPARAAEPEESAGDLVEYRPKFTDEEKRAGLEHIRKFAAARGFPAEWVAKVYEAKFGEPMPLEALAA